MQTATGRLQDRRLEASDRNWSMWMHMSVLLGVLVLGPFTVAAPVIMWLSRRGVSAFNDDHGREVINMCITGVILCALAAATLGVFMIVWVPWAVIALISLIRGAVAASNGEYFRYPMTIRFLQ